jgi:hypothetical protein
MGNRALRLLFLIVLGLSAAAVQGQGTVCTSCPGSYPTVNFYVYYPNGQVTSAKVPIYTASGTINTVRQVMDNAPCPISGFTFTWTSYCPFGAFVDTIGGVSPGSSYWELLINGAYANCGLDTCAVNANDYIEWFVPSNNNSVKHLRTKPAGESTSHQHQIHVKHPKQRKK